MHKFITPTRDKIKHYNTIKASGKVVAMFRHVGEFTVFGLVWQNKFGLHRSLNHLLPFHTSFTGCWVMPLEEYNTHLSGAHGAEFVTIPDGTSAKVLRVLNDGNNILCNIGSNSRSFAIGSCKPYDSGHLTLDESQAQNHTRNSQPK